MRRKFFKLEEKKLSYSHSRGGLIQNSTNLDRMFKVLSVSRAELEVMIEGSTLKGTKTWRLKLNSIEDFNRWIGSVQRALRPDWVKNSVICAECANPFNTFRRQHHCRKCGQTVCSTHSKHKIKIEELGYYTPVRVCDACYTRHNPDSTSFVISSPKITRFRPESLLGSLPRRHSGQLRPTKDP
mmetsp:Transcript_4471/g.8640  ORF Transcript_4471/g.8640 Transcript_4471/m.8640 type:complete len:184 (-) Transcript_4471:43-594(-)